RAAGVRSVDDLAGWDDFRRLPFTRKVELVEDQAAHPPFGSNLTYPLERYVRAADPLARDTGVVGMVDALLGVRPAWGGRRAGGPRLLPILVRALHRLLGGLRGRARPRSARHSRRRAGLGDAPGVDASARRDRARVHALLRAPPARGGARARPG